MFSKISIAFREYLAPGQPAGYGQVTVAFLAIAYGMSKLHQAVQERREELAELGEQADRLREALAVIVPPSTTHTDVADVEITES